MAFSTKAREIHEYIVKIGKADELVGVAKNFITRKRQYEPGPDQVLDIEGLKKELKADLSGAVSGESDADWDEIAKWLLERARPK